MLEKILALNFLPPEEIARRLIEIMRDFQPTREIPAPYYLAVKQPWLHHADALDLAAVIAGTKPLAYINSPPRDKVVGHLLKIAIKSKLIIRAMNINNDPSLLVGWENEALNQLIEARLNFFNQAIDREVWHTITGRCLGYPEEAIQDFLEKLRNRHTR